MLKRIKFKTPSKVPNKYLQEIVFKYLGCSNDRILFGPGVGKDAAAIKMDNNKILIVKSDPITGAVKNIGRFAVVINTNDIAVLGAQPLFFMSTILLPLNSTLADLEIICRDIDQAAKELNIAVIGGHSEITSGIKNPIICGSMLGETTSNKIVRAQSKPGDLLIMTKSAALEGTAILAWEKEHFLEKKIGKIAINNAKAFLNSLSILQEAQLALQIGNITAMHDPTEGGILNGIFEMCVAAGVGAKIYEDKIFVAKETRAICNVFNLDPLRLISSGTLLMSINPQSHDQLLSKLTSSGIKTAYIGEIQREKTITLHRRDGTREALTDQNQDQLWKVFK